MRTLNSNEQTALYQQIKKILIECIENNEWKENEKIPTELELEKHFGVSRITIRQAIIELIEEKYLYRKRGIGTFVTEKKQRKLSKANFMVINTSELIQIHSLSPSREIIDVHEVEADNEIANILNIAPKEKVIIMKRIEYGDRTPISYTVTHIVPKFAPSFMKDISIVKNGFHQYLKEYGTPVSTVEYHINATNVTNETICSLLNIKKNSANILIENTCKSSNNEIIEFSSTIINSKFISIPIIYHY